MLLLLLACADPAVDPIDPADTDTPVDTVPAELPACPSFADPVDAGSVASPQAVELSGLVASRARPGVWWAHNDSGDEPRLLAIGDGGEDLGVVDVDAPFAADWEDIAIGPDGDGWAVFIGDIGDNFRLRQELWIWKVAEPDPASTAPAPATKLRLTYPDGPHDAEALLHDPQTGDLLVVTKDRAGSVVYRAPAPVTDGQELEPIATLAPWDEADDGLITAGDISPDGASVLLRTYSSAWLWRRAAGASLAEAFATDPCPVPLADEPSGEAIAWQADGGGYRSVSEGAAATLWTSLRAP
jgi:hypothetical protein